MKVELWNERGNRWCQHYKKPAT